MCIWLYIAQNTAKCNFWLLYIPSLGSVVQWRGRENACLRASIHYLHFLNEESGTSHPKFHTDFVNGPSEPCFYVLLYISFQSSILLPWVKSQCTLASLQREWDKVQELSQVEAKSCIESVRKKEGHLWSRWTWDTFPLSFSGWQTFHTATTQWLLLSPSNGCSPMTHVLPSPLHYLHLLRESLGLGLWDNTNWDWYGERLMPKTEHVFIKIFVWSFLCGIAA